MASEDVRLLAINMMFKLLHELGNHLRLTVLGHYKISGKCLIFIE